MATKFELMAKQAQGEDVSAKLDEELKKLNKNISVDKANAGSPSTAVLFDATISGGSGAATTGNKNAASKNVAATDATADADNEEKGEKDENN